jgi:hypothetical protein
MIFDHGVFITLVREMRAAQRHYFRDRTPSALLIAKDLERQVDEVIRLFDDASRLQDDQASGDNQLSFLDPPAPDPDGMGTLYD